MRAKPRALALVGALVLLLAALVATTSDSADWTHLNGVSGIQTSGGSSSDDGSRSDELGSQTRDSPAQDDPQRDASALTRPVALTILVVMLAVLVVSVLLGLQLVVKRRKLTGTVRPRATTETDDEPDPEPPDTLSDGVSESLRSVTEGSPRNAIVATWIRLEEAITLAGFEPREAETSTELVRRALTAYPVDEQAIGRLADLYREARFSEHELTEAHRDEAVACLRVLQEQLVQVGAR